MRLPYRHQFRPCLSRDSPSQPSLPRPPIPTTGVVRNCFCSSIIPTRRPSQADVFPTASMHAWSCAPSSKSATFLRLMCPTMLSVDQDSCMRQPLQYHLLIAQSAHNTVRLPDQPNHCSAVRASHCCKVSVSPYHSPISQHKVTCTSSRILTCSGW